jgi:hypothetical protein
MTRATRLVGSCHGNNRLLDAFVRLEQCMCVGLYKQDDNDKKGNGMQRFSAYQSQVCDHQGQWVDAGDNE